MEEENPNEAVAEQEEEISFESQNKSPAPLSEQNTKNSSEENQKNPAMQNAKKSTEGEKQELLRRFKQEISISGYSPRTKTMYTLYAGEFLDFLKKPVGQTQREDIVAFLANKKDLQNVSNATLALVHAALKFFFHNFLNRKIVEEVKIAKKAKKLPNPLTIDEIKALIRAAKKRRTRLIIEFLYSSGCRVSEATSIKLVDLDMKEKIAHVKGGKGNKDRTIILSQKWISELKKYLKKRKTPSDYVFSKKNGKPLSADTIQRIVKKTAQRAGIQKKVSPHTLRHSYATHLLEGGENIRKIQELLGHENLSTTQIYTKVSTEELKKVRSPLDNLKRKKTAKA